MPHYDPIIGLNDFKLVDIREPSGEICLFATFIGKITCPHCSSERLRKKDRFERRIKHHSIGLNRSVLIMELRKYLCYGCGRYFNQRLPGVRLRFQGTEIFRNEVAQKHRDGFSKAKSAEQFRISSSSVERCYRSFLRTKESHRSNAYCPRVLGIDEKFFTKKKGFMTTLCDLKERKVFELALGRSELSLRDRLVKIPERQRCKVVVIDLSETYRSIAKKYFVNAMIVTDRFHVVKLLNLQFLRTWRALDEVGSKSRGLLSLMRRHPEKLKPEQKIKLDRYFTEHPAIGALYHFKQHVMQLVLSRVSSKTQAKRLIPQFLEAVHLLKTSGFKYMKTLGETFENWQTEIVGMWRFGSTSLTGAVRTFVKLVLPQTTSTKGCPECPITTLSLV